MIREIFQAIDCPIWIKNIENKVVFVNESFKSKFNINIETEEAIIDEYLKNNKNLKELSSTIMQLKGKSFLTSNIKGRLYKHVVFYCDNKLNNLAGMMIDVSDIKEMYNTKNEKNILKTVIDNIPSLIFYKDKDLKYVGVNEECKKFYKERGVDNVIGKTDLEMPLDKNFIETCSNHDKIVLKTKKPLYIEENIPVPNSEELGTAHTIKTPIINDDGSVWGLVGVVRDITEQKEIENKLRYLSYKDQLTNLYNRAYFDDKINEFVKNKQFPIGIISGDVNGLKIVNDTLGHTEGDKLLKSIAKILTEACSEKNIVCRWGGDEFVTIIPNASDIECETFINKVKELCNIEAGENFKVSIAQGYSLFKEGNNIDDILRESEDKVYKQKIFDKKSVRSSILETLNKNLQSKNVETEEHTERVANYCLKVGEALNIDEENLDKLALLGKLHDIGKTGIPEHILLKKEKLTDDEYEIMKTHSEKGYRLALLFPEFSHIARGILTHHERWDGRGYPLGLKGDEIPLISRIVSVADAFDTMVNSNDYDEIRSIDYAINELRNCAGTQFDPEIVDVFCTIIDK